MEAGVLTGNVEGVITSGQDHPIYFSREKRTAATTFYNLITWHGEAERLACGLWGGFPCFLGLFLAHCFS